MAIPIENILTLMQSKGVLDRFKELGTHQPIAPFYMSRNMGGDRERFWFPTEFDPQTNIFYGKVLGDEHEYGSFSLQELCEIGVEFHWKEKTKDEIDKRFNLNILSLETWHDTIIRWDTQSIVGYFGDGSILTCEISRSKKFSVAVAHLSRHELTKRKLSDGTEYTSKVTKLYDRLRGTYIQGMPCERSGNRKALVYTIEEGFKHAINHFGGLGFKVNIV